MEHYEFNGAFYFVLPDIIKTGFCQTEFMPKILNLMQEEFDWHTNNFVSINCDGHSIDYEEGILLATLINGLQNKTPIVFSGHVSGYASGSNALVWASCFNRTIGAFGTIVLPTIKVETIKQNLTVGELKMLGDKIQRLAHVVSMIMSTAASQFKPTGKYASIKYWYDSVVTDEGVLLDETNLRIRGIINGDGVANEGFFGI